MTHHHDHHHHEHHHHSDEESMPFEGKLVKLLEHWIQHNRDHVANYMAWADRADENGFKAVADLLKDAARQTETTTVTFEKALSAVHG